jgi:hypothetical protein
MAKFAEFFKTNRAVRVTAHSVTGAELESSSILLTSVVG